MISDFHAAVRRFFLMNLRDELKDCDTKLHHALRKLNQATDDALTATQILERRFLLDQIADNERIKRGEGSADAAEADLSAAFDSFFLSDDDKP